MTQEEKPIPRPRRDLVFERLSKDCPNKKNYFERGIKHRCLANGCPCSPQNCGPYHWFKRKS